MTATAPLLSRYADAREAFLETCARAGCTPESFLHPERGPEGETLALDLAVLGDPDADAGVLVVSGTHGVEGIAGSALQRRWLAEGEPVLPEACCVVVAHAINPWGFAHKRRVDSGNVDVNRNFVDWAEAPPANPAYGELAALVVPPQWDDATQQRTTATLLERAGRMGIDAFQSAVTRGQYEHPEGLYFGGTGPSWTHERIEWLCRERLTRFRRLAVIDLHTGLGPWSHGELILSASKESPLYPRGMAMFGEVCSQHDGDSVSTHLDGEWVVRMHDWLPDTIATPVALEFGTVEPVTVLQALRADAWLHAYGDPGGREAAPIKRELLRVFCDEDPKWLDALWLRFHEVLGQALVGVRAGA